MADSPAKAELMPDYGAPFILDDRDERCTDAEYISLARRHRERLRAVVVAVTGSCGKTTTKDLTASVLGRRLRGTKSEDTKNCGLDLCATVLATSPQDDFMVQELGAWGPGTLDAGIEFIRPDIAVVTNLRNDHYSTLHGPSGAQAEKGKLVRCLPDTGAAVLNWDDPLVRELTSWTQARTVTFGLHAGADLRGTDVRADWPATLSFTAAYDGARVAVHTQLLGEHLVGSALAALAVGLLLGMSLEDAADALESSAPTFRRMSQTANADGVMFVRDDWKAPADSLPEVLTFMSHATASRKILVLGRISDFAGRSRHTYERVAQRSMATTDVVIFVGDRASALWPDPDAYPQTPGSASQGQMFVFATVRQAAAFLDEYLAPGDLVVLKGSGPADHLERVLLGREQPVACWLEDCGRLHPCDVCELVRARVRTGQPDGS